jgi:copper(I)-binding protein
MLGLRGPSRPRPGLLGGRVEAAASAATMARAAVTARAAIPARAAIGACLLAAGGAAIAGCDQPASAAPAIELGSASIPQPDVGGTTDAFLVIRNNGPANRLISVRTSDGGRVAFRAPAGSGSGMRTVPDIGIPARAVVRLVPDGPHLEITGAGPMRGSTLITLTLVFARGGSFAVQAEITNPQSGGSSYF